MFRYFIIYKPFRVLSQFSSVEGKETLADYYKIAKDIYPVGRLDYDSEGLLILTNDPQINHRLLNPQFAHEREYWVQVEGLVTLEALDELRRGVVISKDGKMYTTLPCKASLFSEAPTVSLRYPPIRFRKNVSDCWISLQLIEGKNRQVRKMTAKVGFPTLRLIRNSIGKITLKTMQPGQIKQLSKQEMYEGLFGK